MNSTNPVLQAIDSQIEALQQARLLLIESPSKNGKHTVTHGPRNTRPQTEKRSMSKAARKKISEAIKKRWADKRKAAAKR